MSPAGTFERVYQAIKRHLRNGTFRPGVRLEPAVLSDQLNASVTPVRDALHRLTGERLVEAPPHEGFRTPMLSEPMLRHLYSWHLDLVLLAVAKHRAEALADPLVGDGAGLSAQAAERQSELFLALARSTGNPEHFAALESLSQRLAPVRRFEERFLDQTGAETSEIVTALQQRDWKALRLSLLRYHRRRERIVPQLLDRLLQE